MFLVPRRLVCVDSCVKILIDFSRNLYFENVTEDVDAFSRIGV